MFKYVNNIKMDLLRVRMGWYVLDRSGSGKGPVEGSCEHGNEPSGSINFGKFLRSFSRWAQFHQVSQNVHYFTAINF
jgi:hypothetical protein